MKKLSTDTIVSLHVIRMNLITDISKQCIPHDDTVIKNRMENLVLTYFGKVQNLMEEDEQIISPHKS